MYTEAWCMCAGVVDLPIVGGLDGGLRAHIWAGKVEVHGKERSLAG